MPAPSWGHPCQTLNPRYTPHLGELPPPSRRQQLEVRSERSGVQTLVPASLGWHPCSAITRSVTSAGYLTLFMHLSVLISEMGIIQVWLF